MCAIMHYKNCYNFRANLFLNNSENEKISSLKHHFYISRSFMASRRDADPLKLQMPLATVV